MMEITMTKKADTVAEAKKVEDIGLANMSDTGRGEAASQATHPFNMADTAPGRAAGRATCPGMGMAMKKCSLGRAEEYLVLS